MFMRLSRAPALASAIAVVVATAGYALSQGSPLGTGWNLNSPGAAADAIAGPPIPDKSASKPSGSPVAAKSGAQAVGPDATTGSREIPDIALRLLYGPDFDRVEVGADDSSEPSAADPVAKPDRTVLAESESAPVRTIELPRRPEPAPGDMTSVPYPGMPGDAVAISEEPAETPGSDPAVPDTASVESGEVVPKPIPRPETALTNAAGREADNAESRTATIDPTLVAPIPAPVSRRPAPPPPVSAPDLEPIPSQSVASSEYRRARRAPSEVTSIKRLRRVSADPMVHNEVEGSWPRRLDQVNVRRSVERYVADRINPNNVFMSDWVQVETEHGIHIVPK